MSGTFDPGTFDIHEIEDQKPDVYPITKDEKIDPRVLKGNAPVTEHRTKSKKVLVGIIANVFLPGLGNIFLKKSTISTILLALNLILLITALSPTSMLGFIGNMAYPTYPAILATTPTLVASEPNMQIVVNPETAWIFYTAIIIAIVTWIHFIYLIFAKKGNTAKGKKSGIRGKPGKA